MSGAHCIDFYNKSTLTFIVFIFVSHRAFSSTAKTSAESFLLLLFVAAGRCGVGPNFSVCPWGWLG